MIRLISTILFVLFVFAIVLFASLSFAGDWGEEIIDGKPFYDGDLLGDDTVDDDSLDFGTGTDQISAEDIPIADAGDYYTGTEVETALQEISDGTALDDLYHRLDSTNTPFTGNPRLGTGVRIEWVDESTYIELDGNDQKYVVKGELRMTLTTIVSANNVLSKIGNQVLSKIGNIVISQ